MSQRIVRAIRNTSTTLWQGLFTKRPHMAYVGGWHGNQNLGDETLYEAIKVLFPQCGIIPYPCSRGRAITIACKMFGTFKYGLLGGGTLINNGTSITRLAKECFPLCRHNFVFGTGVAHPSFWLGRKDWTDSRDQWKPLLESCRYVGVRGPISADLLSEAGVPNVEVIGDPVLAFAEDNSSDVANDDSVGLNIGHSYGYVWGSEAEIKKEFIKLAVLAKKHGWKVSWFVVWAKDLDLTLETAKASGTEDEIYQIYADPLKYLKLVRDKSVFVGMKLHAVALATCAYVPSIMLEYRPKCRDYMRSIEQEAYTVRTDCFTAEYVWDLISSLNADRTRLYHILSEKIKFLRDKQISKASDLMKIFQESK